ncbi:hypothetical protein JMA_37510 (plasmid) [Jeotgalibacillus malaysiensis]|uniref:Uncharacterized protein n=1 Tax=Jeotgalibacillus malaysiensis TaxID=1508404 RepID=A0A0B5AYI9_9BACL|nr:hypothetical protein [Jeotgalibacillus malaysiensis]AJD93069.1 hypothetical protein JMA_37510 [Jeotgalibacillus malaysiensis]
MKIQKFMMERDVSLKKIEEDSHRQESIHNGLQEADNMFQELKKEKDIHLGDSFVFSLYVTASMSKKKEGIYYDVYIEEKKVSSRLVKPNES